MQRRKEGDEKKEGKVTKEREMGTCRESDDKVD